MSLTFIYKNTWSFDLIGEKVLIGVRENISSLVSETFYFEVYNFKNVYGTAAVLPGKLFLVA